MMKKGVSHIDWAISISTFLVFMILLFTFVKPGVKKDYDAEALLDLIEKNLEEDIELKVEKTPIFLTLNDGVGPGYYKVQIVFETFPFSGQDEDFTLLNATEGQLDFSLNANGSTKVMRFDAYVEDDKANRYILLYSEGANYNNNGPDEGIEINNNDHFTYDIGATETVRGMFEENITLLGERSYESIKQGWNFPQNREFSVRVINKTGGYSDNDILLTKTGQELEQAAVAVREKKKWIMDEYTNKRGATVNLRVW